MKIVWQNLGYSFPEWMWIKLLTKFGLQYRDELFYTPDNAVLIQDWVRRCGADVFLGCEVITDRDAQTIAWNPSVSVVRIDSLHHAHGRVIATSVPYIMRQDIIDDEIITSFEFDSYIIIPVHLHWCNPSARLAQVRHYCAAVSGMQKPVVVIGDFNIYTWMNRWQLFDDDRSAIQLLRQQLVEVSSNIIMTNIIPGIKLDYVWVSPELADRVFVTKPPRPIWRMDHSPLLVTVQSITR